MSSVDHYENFPVASILMPRRLRKPVAAIYHFARAADDIADEGELPNEERLQQLDEFRDELKHIAAGETPQPPCSSISLPKYRQMHCRCSRSTTCSMPSRRTW